MEGVESVTVVTVWGVVVEAVFLAFGRRSMVQMWSCSAVEASNIPFCGVAAVT